MLKEHPRERSQERMANELFEGMVYTRVFTCPKGEVAEHLEGELKRGADLQPEWGGDATDATVTRPMLQVVQRVQNKGTSMERLVGQFVEIFPEEYVMAYTETSRSRPRQITMHENVITTVGVALNESDSGLPSQGDFIDAESNVLTGHICQDIRYDPTIHIGRIFVFCTWVGLRAKPT